MNLCVHCYTQRILKNTRQLTMNANNTGNMNRTICFKMHLKVTSESESNECFHLFRAGYVFAGIYLCLVCWQNDSKSCGSELFTVCVYSD